MSLMSVSDAAEALGVSTRQVQYLVANGALHPVARGVLDATSVERYQAVRSGSHSRAWAEVTAWGAVALLSGKQASWMGESQRSRLRARLRSMDGSELVERCRDRAVVSRYRAHTRAGRYLAADLIEAARDGRRGLGETDAVDGYLAARDVDDVVRRNGLIRDGDGRVTLRATTFDLDVVRDLASGSAVLGALDLAESLDVRERRAGIDALERALAGIRG